MESKSRPPLFERLKNGLRQCIEYAKKIVDPPAKCCKCKQNKNIMVVGLESDGKPYKVYCLDCWQKLT